MSDKEALAEFDRIQAIAPAESYSEEAEAKAAKLFAALLPTAMEKDAVQADMIMTHPMPFIRAIARHYEAELRKDVE